MLRLLVSKSADAEVRFLALYSDFEDSEAKLA